MKKILLICFVTVIVFVLSACSNNDQVAIETKQEIQTETTQKIEVEYYSGTSIPTISFITGASEIKEKDYPLYGPFETESSALLYAEMYVSILVEQYGFKEIENSAYYELTNGINSISIVGGTYSGKYAIAALVE